MISLIWLLIVVLLVILVLVLLDRIPLGEPAKSVLLVVILLIIVVFLLQILGGISLTVPHRP
jgi:hypothetical protein